MYLKWNIYLPMKLTDEHSNTEICYWWDHYSGRTNMVKFDKSYTVSIIVCNIFGQTFAGHLLKYLYSPHSILTLLVKKVVLHKIY